MLLRTCLLISSCLIGITGCTSDEPIQTKSLIPKNSIEHTFNLNRQQLQDTIISIFSIKNQIPSNILNPIFNTHNTVTVFQAETSRDTLFSKEYFKNPANVNDIFLHNFREPWRSRYYYSESHSLKFVADFVVMLRPLNDSTTRTTIMAYKPEVINGIVGYGPHGAVARYTPVQPTTIEEHTLLQFIAAKVGDHSIAPLRLPKD